MDKNGALKPQGMLGFDAPYWSFILVISFLGAFLRLYLLTDQILLNDEWHSLYYVCDKTFSFLLTNISVGANSVPMNLYCWFLLKTFGWSELLLKLPSLAVGIVSLIALPLYIKKIFNKRVSIIFAFLYAISPVLIFYSRNFRPFSMVASLGFLSILFLYLWAVHGNIRYAILYILTGVSAIYLHVYAGIAILPPLGFLLIMKLNNRFTDVIKQGMKITPGITAILSLAAIIVFLLSVLLLPALSKNLWWENALFKDRVTLNTIINLFYLLSGCSNMLMTFVFIILFFYGLYCLMKGRFIFGGMLSLILISYSLVLSTTRQLGISAAIESARYSICIFPVCFTLVAYGIDCLLQHVHSDKPLNNYRFLFFSNLLASIFLLVLLITGPFKNIYVKPNNFTNHYAFQQNCVPISWDESVNNEFLPGYRMGKNRIPSFYFQISKERHGANTIIEYPMFIGDRFNLYYYYQHFHKNRIIVGYYPRLKYLKSQKTEHVFGYYYPCMVLSRVLDASKLKFRNMIDITDIGAIKSSHADYIILHKNLMEEMFPGLKQVVFSVLPILKDLRLSYREYFGPPIFEDQNIIVFKLTS